MARLELEWMLDPSRIIKLVNYFLWTQSLAIGFTIWQSGIQNRFPFCICALLWNKQILHGLDCWFGSGLSFVLQARCIFWGSKPTRNSIWFYLVLWLESLHLYQNLGDVPSLRWFLSDPESGWCSLIAVVSQWARIWAMFPHCGGFSVSQNLGDVPSLRWFLSKLSVSHFRSYIPLPVVTI